MAGCISRGRAGGAWETEEGIGSVWGEDASRWFLVVQFLNRGRR